MAESPNKSLVNMVYDYGPVFRARRASASTGLPTVKLTRRIIIQRTFR